MKDYAVEEYGPLHWRIGDESRNEDELRTDGQYADHEEGEHLGKLREGRGTDSRMLP